MLYDTHAHPYLADTKSQESILENFFQTPDNFLNAIGTNLENSQTCIDLCHEYTNIRAVIGIHPCEVLEYKNSLSDAIERLKSLSTRYGENVVAIGEIGLDYYWLKQISKTANLSLDEVVSIQSDFFRAQIHLAKELGLPIVIHSRASSEDTAKILMQEDMKNFVFHCYSDDLEFAQKILEFAPDALLGFGGVMTFKNAQSVQNTAKNIPLKNIVLETDSPYLTPVPYRGKQENEPLYTQYVLDALIDIRDEPADIIESSVYNNAMEFFGLRE